MAAVMLMGMGIVASAEETAERAVVETGYCGAQGENLVWTLYNDGELVISGEGEMADYSRENYPAWYDLYDKIDVVTLEEGVTTIGEYAFDHPYCDDYDYATFDRLNLPVSLEKVGYEGLVIDYSDIIHYYTNPGSTIQFVCYAGSEAQWKKVKFEDYDGDVFYTDNLDCHYDCEIRKMYFNGEEPKTQCTILPTNDYTLSEWTDDNYVICYGETVELVAFAYSAEDIEGATVVYSAEGYGVNTESYICNHGVEHITFNAYETGSVTLEAQLVAEDGTVLASDSIEIETKAGIKEIIDYLIREIRRIFIEFLWDIVIYI